MDHDQVVDASYTDIENILECLHTGNKISRESKMSGEASKMLNKVLLDCFEEICKEVHGFSEITTNTDEIKQSVIHEALTLGANEG